MEHTQRFLRGVESHMEHLVALPAFAYVQAAHAHIASVVSLVAKEGATSDVRNVPHNSQVMLGVLFV